MKPRAWKTAPWAVIDTETTGLDTSTARIWEIAVLQRSPDEQRRTARTLVNPGQAVPAEVQELCGLDAAELDAIARAPRFGAVVGRLAAHLRDRIVVGYNLLHYDWPLLQAEARRAGSAALDHLGSVPLLDVLVLVRELRPTLRSYRLESVAAAFGLNAAGAHGAKADVRMTCDVLVALLPDLPAELDSLLRLQERWRTGQQQEFERYGYWLRSGPDGLRMACGKHCGLPLDAVPKGYLRYLLAAQRSWERPLPEAVVEAFERAVDRAEET